MVWSVVNRAWRRVEWVSTRLTVLRNFLFVCGVAAVGISFLAASMDDNPRLRGGLVLLAAFFFGLAGGALLHLAVATRRDSALGYRVQKVEHEYRIDPHDIRKHVRKRAEFVIPHRRDVRIIEGRYRPSMNGAPRVRTTSKNAALALVHARTHQSDWDRYVVAFDQPLERGKVHPVRTEMEIFDDDGSSDSHYRSTVTSKWSSIGFLLCLPPTLVKAGSMEFTSERIVNGNATARRSHDFEYDDSTGEFRAAVKLPGPGRTYCVSWEWNGYAASVRARI